MSKKLALCLVLVAVLTSSVAFAGHHEEEYKKLAENWEAAYNNDGAAAVAALYMEDGMRMPPDMPIVKGRPAIQGQVQGGMDQGLAKVEIELVEATISGETGVSRGTFKGFAADGTAMTEGKWMSVSHYVDGKWQIHADIWNMDAPMPAPE